MYKSKEEALTAIVDAEHQLKVAKNYIENNSSDKLVKMEETFVELINGLKHKYESGYITAYNDNDKVIFQQDLRNKTVWFSYYTVWSVFESNYGLNYNDFKSFTNGMVEKHMNCNGFTTTFDNCYNLRRLEKHMNYIEFTEHYRQLHFLE